MEQSSPSSRMVGTVGGNDSASNRSMSQPPHSPYLGRNQMSYPPPPPPGAGFSSFPPPPPPPPQVGAHMGSSPPSDPQRQQLLQLQIRQHQLQLQQLQAQQKRHEADRHRHDHPQQRQQHGMSPSAQQQQFVAPRPQQSFAPPASSVSVPLAPSQQQQHQHHYPSGTKPTIAATPTAFIPPSTIQKLVPGGSPPSAEQIQKWVSQCDWRDRAIYVSRQLFGGTSVNGFSKATAAAQRIKKQRARQVAIQKKNFKRAAAAAATATEDALTSTTTTPSTSTTSTTTTTAFEPTPTEEEVKHGTMNPRTAKKIKAELEQGLDFIKSLYESAQSIIQELDPSGRLLPPPIDTPASGWNPAPAFRNRLQLVQQQPLPPPASRMMTMPAPLVAPTPPTTNAKRNSSRKMTAVAQLPIHKSSTSCSNSKGNPQGSTQRRYRKDKLKHHPLEVNLSEFDVAGKRVFTKRDHVYRIAELLRFRGLKAGDYVAARISSRDLWILARVVKNYDALPMDPTEFLSLTNAKRDALFREKVVIKDAEERESGAPILVPRHLVLPLPRSFGEAAEWGTRLKKGTRVYAMYPNTTSLYVATVVDGTTYCRGNDDIIVVEFDEDEKDAAGNVPKCHIPARFVLLIPGEFPSSNDTAAMKRGSTSKPAARSSASKSTTRPDDNAALDDMMAYVVAGAGHDNYDPFDFD